MAPSANLTRLTCEQMGFNSPPACCYHLELEGLGASSAPLESSSLSEASTLSLNASFSSSGRDRHIAPSSFAISPNFSSGFFATRAWNSGQCGTLTAGAQPKRIASCARGHCRIFTPLCSPGRSKGKLRLAVSISWALCNTVRRNAFRPLMVGEFWPPRRVTPLCVRSVQCLCALQCSQPLESRAAQPTGVWKPWQRSSLHPCWNPYLQQPSAGTVLSRPPPATATWLRAP